MTKVPHAGAHRGVHQKTASSSSIHMPTSGSRHAPVTLDRPRALRKKKPYKIILEAVTQEKRKLQSIVSYHDQAPSGFGYIPVGYPEITEWCKEQCRQRNLDVHIVSAKPRSRAHADPEKISHHVHRIGHHFPLDIIELACSKFGYDFNEKDGLQKQKGSGTTYGEAYFERGIADYHQRQQLHGRPVTDTETKDYIRGAVREMFPKIPEADLTSIVNHAFEEGTDRVGNAKELSLARRVQLAVVAHIRHTYTEYDTILKTGSWTEARQKVEHVSLAKLKEWRDEAGQTNHELEETFREVIILDDDENESSDGETLPNVDKRELSMDIFSSRATARDLQPEPAGHAREDARYMQRAPRRTIVLRPAAYYRPSAISNTASAHHLAHTSRTGSRAPPIAAHESVGNRPDLFRIAHSRPLETVTREMTVRDVPPMQMRDSDGHLYNLQPIKSQGEERRRPLENTPRTPHGSRSSTVVHRPREQLGPVSQRVVPADGNSSRTAEAPSSRRASEQDVVLPSIEREPGEVSSPRHVADALHQNRLKRLSGALSYTEIPPPKRREGPVFMHSAEERMLEAASKRLRPVYDDEAYARSGLSQSVVSRIHDYQPVDSYRQPRVQPLYEPIDLTSSPRRPPYDGTNEVYRPVRPHTTAGSSNHLYHSAPSRTSTVRDVRDAYREAPVRDSSRAYVPDDRMYDSRVVIPHHSNALREEAVRFQTEGGRFLSNGADYGTHKLH